MSAQRVAIKTHLGSKVQGKGPPMLLFHGGVGSWRHWVRNIDIWAEHFEVHALDLPGYGTAGAVPRDIEPQDYLCLVYDLLRAHFGQERPLHFVGFSFGAAVASVCAVWMQEQVVAYTAIGPRGFARKPGSRPLNTKSYKAARNDEEFHDIMHHNLLTIMCLHPDSITEEVLAYQRYNIENLKGMDSRKISLLPVMAENLGKMCCPTQLIYGSEDQVAFDVLNARIAVCRVAQPALQVKVIDNCGHWAMLEAAEQVNTAVLDMHQVVAKEALG